MKIKITFLTIILLAGCAKNQEDYLVEEGSQILTASTLTDSVEADGRSNVTIYAMLTTKANLKTVAFSTNAGMFLDSNKTYSTEATIEGTQLVAKAVLITGLETTDQVHVKVSVPKVDRVIPLRFVNAYPDSINIQSPAGSIVREFGASIPLNIFLLRTTGIPSLHQTIKLNAVKSDNSEISLDIDAMDPSGSDQRGLIKANLILKDTTYTGPIHIIARAQGKLNTLSDSLTIFITDKK